MRILIAKADQGRLLWERTRLDLSALLDDLVRDFQLLAAGEARDLRLDAAVETSYRFSHDSFGVQGHTASVEWFQNAGSKLVLAPLFRYHRQTAASFCGVRFAGDPSDPESFPDVVIPPFYSADYRLSELETWTLGLSVSWRVTRRCSVEAAYKHYQMWGLDGITAASNYPETEIWTAGLRLQF